MAKIAENTVIVDGQEYKPGDVIPDFKSIKCVDTREPRKYQGLSADVSVLNDVIAKYASGGASCFMSDTGEYYEYDRKEKAWKLITNITERGFDSEKAYGALKHMLKNVTVSDEKIQSAVTNYLTVNPVLPGATTEQAQQIEQNKTDVASLKEETGSLREDIGNLNDKKITKFYASNLGETHITDSDNGKIMDMMVYGKSSQDGTPTPENPVQIKSVVNPTVKIVGKNLLNATLQTITLNGVTCINNGDGTYTLNGTSTVDTDFYIYGAYNTVNKLCLDSQKTYIVKKSGNSKIQFHVGEANVYTTVASLEDGQIKNQAIISFFICRILSGAILNNFTIYPQVEEGSASTDFQPYHEQAVAIPYTLNAIPVESGGNVTIDGQQYVADRVVEKDGVFGIERNIREIHVNTKTMNNSEMYPGWNKVEGVSDVTYYNEAATREARKLFYTSNFTNAPLFQNNNETNNILYYIRNVIGYSQSDLIAKAIDVDMYIRLQNAIFEPLPVDMQAKLRTLVTNYPVTNISVNSEQLDGYTVFNYPISLANGWNYVKQQLNDNRDYIYDMDLQSAEAYVNSEYAVALTELEV